MNRMGQASRSHTLAGRIPHLGGWVVAARRSPAVVLAAAGLLAVGQWLWYRDMSAFLPGALVAGPGLLLAMWAARPARATHLRATAASLQHSGRLLSARLIVAAAGLALCVYVGWSAVQQQHPVWIYLTGWGAGIGLTIAGLVPHSEVGAWAQEVRTSLRTEPRMWRGLGVLFLVGLAVRVAYLESVPYLMAGDEAQFAYEAVSVAQDLNWHYSPFEMGIWHHPRTVHTLMAVSIELLGQTKAAARLPWALFGALTVPAVYWLGRSLVHRRVGWTAAIFMATFPVHVQFSRTGMDMTGDPLFAALAVGLLARSLRRGDRMDAALAGLAGGLAQYFYFAGRLVLLVLGVYVIASLVRAPCQAGRQIGVLLVAGVVLAAVVFPYSYAAYRDTTRPSSPRLDAVGVWQTGAAADAAAEGRARTFWTAQLHGGLMAYLQVPDKSAIYGPYGALLGWFAGVPFLLGVAVAARRWRDPAHLILLAWVAGTAILGGVLLIDPPHYPRYISATPPLAVLVGIGLATLGAALARALAAGDALRPRAVVVLRRTLPVLLAGSLAAANLGFYVVDYVPRRLWYGERTVRLNEVVQIAATFNGAYRVHTLSSENLDMNSTDLLRYLTAENAGVEYTGEVDHLPAGLDPGWHAFVVAPERLADLYRLTARIPGGELRQYASPRTYEPLVYTYVVRIN